MDEYKILGYTNPTESLCGPLVTIVEVNNRIGAIFPDLTFYYLDILSIYNIKNIIIEHSNRYIKKMQYSYLSIDKKIYVLNENVIISLMERDFKILKNIGNNDLADIINEMIGLEHNRVSNINPFFYLKNINSISQDFKVFFTNRRKANGVIAKRLIVQQSKNGRYNTCYKKNLRFSDLKDYDSCRKDYKRISYKLNKAMANIAERVKTKDFEGLLLSA